LLLSQVGTWFVWHSGALLDEIADFQATQVFQDLRRRLFGLAYRMLGSRAEAEDIVQEGYLRWHDSDRNAIRNPEAWLTTAVTRLAIDRLRKLKLDREKYAGPWLPEPLVDSAEADVELAQSLSLAFVTLLERLAPEERAAFLLHDVFDLGYSEVASVLDRSEAACRQVLHRARERVRGGQKRFTATAEDKARLLRKFTEAVEANDSQTLLTLFAPDARWIGDGGGVVPSSPRPVVGVPAIANLAINIWNKYLKGQRRVEVANVNGEPGLCVWDNGRLTGTLSIATDGQQIIEVLVVLNPDKLRRVGDEESNKRI
jgi:RNA polymerase sigma-70 factor (ECF subfamily)